MRTDPSLARQIADYRAGRLDPAEWVAGRKRHLVREVAVFLDARGDPARLGALLREDWRLVFHPVVCRVLVGLWREGAGEPLRRVLEAWLQGVLPGAHLAVPAGGRGTRRPAARHDFVSRDHADFRARLGLYDPAPGPGESAEEWRARWRETLRVVWAEADVAGYTYGVTEPGSGARAIREAAPPLPDRRLREWVAAAHRRLPHGDAVHDDLASCLAAHRWGLSRAALRALLAAGRRKAARLTHLAGR